MPRKAGTRCPFPKFVERTLVDSHSLLLEPLRSALRARTIRRQRPAPAHLPRSQQQARLILARRFPVGGIAVSPVGSPVSTDVRSKPIRVEVVPQALSKPISRFQRYVAKWPLKRSNSTVARVTSRLSARILRMSSAHSARICSCSATVDLPVAVQV